MIKTKSTLDPIQTNNDNHQVWKCPIHNLPIQNICAFENCESRSLCLICHKDHSASHLAHTYSTPQGNVDVQIESLYQSLGLRLKKLQYPIEEVFDKVQEHMQLVWKKLCETVKKKLRNELKTSALWKKKIVVDKCAETHRKAQTVATLTEYVGHLDQFVRRWFLGDKKETQRETDRLNQVFSEFAMKTEKVGNQLCSLIQKSLVEYTKEVQIQDMSSLLSQLKTEQLVISSTYDFYVSKRDAPFFTETFNPQSIHYMLDLLNKRTSETRQSLRLNDMFNSRFSTFSKHPLTKSKVHTDAFSESRSQRKDLVMSNQKNNPFEGQLSSDASGSKIEIRHSLPATGQWEGHSRPSYYTNWNAENKSRHRSQIAHERKVYKHKSENISLIGGSNSDEHKEAMHSAFNNSFSQR